MFGGGGVSGGGGNGLPGAPGKSAYQVALDNGFVGTQSEWLATLDGVDGAPGPQGVPGDVGRAGDPGPKGLDGEDAYHLAIDDGFAGTLTDWLASIKGDKGDKGDVGDTGPDGLSAYQIAVAGGFTGTQDVWLTTLKGADGAQGPRGFQGDKGDTGAPGADGASAYAVALDNGFVGTEAQWLLSIHGADGAPGSQGDVGQQGPVGPAGTDGLNGKSAYELAVTGGFSGTQDQWLASLKGADGAKGDKGDTGIAGADGVDGDSAYQLAIGEGFVGTLSDWLNSLKGADGAQGPQGIQGQQGFQGQQGTPGINGNSVLNGTTAPATGVGNDGDFYINKTTNVIYGPKAAGAWPTGGTALVGPQGPQGVQGVQGTAGTNGNTLLNGSGSPVAATGRDGDFFLDTNTNTFYGPKAAGAWPSTGTSIVGPQGPQGIQGTPGTAGSDGVNGKTAYELAVTQGYSGTLSDWLASLQGAQGPQGPAGVVAAGTHGDVTVAADSTFTVLRAGTLTTARNINGVAFDGSASITINAVDATAREPAIGAGTTAQYWRGDKTWQTLNSSAVGLGNVNNTADAVKIVASAGKLTTPRNINGVAFDGSADITINAVDATPRIATSLMGVANGVATLAGNGLIPSSQLPSYVDDVLEFANLAAFPTTGETGKIYIADDTNFEYRWTGTQYFRLVSSPGTTDALTEGTSNLYFTTARAIAALGNATITGGLTATGNFVGSLLAANNQLICRGGAAGGSEGGQLILGYGGGLANSIGGQANNTWNIDVSSSNALRLFNQRNDGSVITALTFDEATGKATFAYKNTIKANFAELRMSSASANLGWRMISNITGATDGSLVFQHSTDDFSANFTNGLTLFGDGTFALAGGGSVGGTLTVNTNNGSLNISCAAGTQAVHFFQRAAVNRWAVSSDNATESGSNVGTNFNISRYTDAGAWLDNPFSIDRSTGNVSIAHSLTVNGGRTVVGMGSDGGLEIGNYIDFHNPTNDGLDYKARISVGSGGGFTLTAAALTVTGPLLYVNSGNLVLQHDGTDGYIRADVGTLNLGASGVNTLRLLNTGQTIQQVSTGYFTNNGSGGSYNVGYYNAKAGGGQVGYHMYNGGAVNEWVLYQPAHATGDDLRFAIGVGGTLADKYRFDNAGGFSLTGSNAGISFNDRTAGSTAFWVAYNASNAFRIWSNTAGSDRFNIDASGNAWFAGNITSASDRRLKKHISYKVPFGLKDVLQLKPVTYRWKGQPNSEPKDIGFIAQDVEEIFPELVRTDEHGMKSVDYQKTTVVLLQALKELVVRLEKVERR